ncbi:MAG: V-type ATP synthase subunit I [Christensenellales bacterium]|jgi:V/A-type H+-transporting ATPase subunit I
MAIVEMRHLSLAALKSDREDLLWLMQTMQCVEVSPVEHEEKQLSLLTDASVELVRVKGAIDQLSRYAQKKGFSLVNLPPKITKGERERVAMEKDRLFEVVEELERINRQRGANRGQLARIQANREEIAPWRELHAMAEDFGDRGQITIYAGSIQTRNLVNLQDSISDLPAGIEVGNVFGDRTLLLVAYDNSVEEEVRVALNTVDFSRESFAMLEGKTPFAYLSYLEEEEQKILASDILLDEQEQAFSSSLPDLKILHDLIVIEQKKNQVIHTGSVDSDLAFMAQGWIPASLADEFKLRALKVAPYCAIEIREPLDDENPPVALQNGPFATAFEPVVEGFSLPDYRGIDPTAVMAPFYACLFGMMVSDAGYGLLMAVVLWLYLKINRIKVKNAKMLYLLLFGGLATVVWGIVYNTIFGFNPIPKLAAYFPLDSVNDPMPVMALCIIVGAIHLFTGVGVAAYMNARKGDWVAVVSDQLSWAMLLIGLGLLVSPLAHIGKWLAIAGAGIILLMTGRDSKNPIKRLISGLGALYGITGWVSDLLSYMRLFGMGLATGVIGMVFNTLISMVWSGGLLAKILAIVLFVGCHLFNLGINALGAYVHSCRLQYIEFFGKFYEDGGVPFRPLDLKTRFVDLSEAF